MAPPRHDDPPFFQQSSEGGHAYHGNPPEQEWSSGLCGYCGDSNACCKTIICPCWTSGQIAEIVSEGNTSKGEACFITCMLGFMCACIWGYTCHYRGKTRKRFHIKGGGCSDCCVHFFCLWCALCQEYRELEYHGFDPSLGWTANKERRRNTAGMYPPVPEEMRR